MEGYIIVIEYNDDSFLWMNDGWKDYVCMDFDENVVATGNRDYSDIVEASWWKDAIAAIDEADEQYEEADFIANMEDEYAPDKLHDIWEAIQHCRDCYDPEFVAKVAMILDPNLSLSTSTIRGNSQGDWQDVVYVDGAVDESTLEDWYFGNVYEARVYDLATAELTDNGEIEDYGEDIDNAYITSTEYFRMSSGDEKKAFRKFFNLPEDATIIIIDD